MDRAARVREINEKSNLVFLRFYLIFYFCILMGIFFQYIFLSSDRLLKYCAFGVTTAALILQVAGYFALKKKSFYGKYSLIIGCIFFTVVNFISVGSEVLLLFIPFCTISILETDRRALIALYIVWIANAFMRVVILSLRSGTAFIQYRNLYWISFVCIMFATALNMVNRFIGVYYSEVIDDLFSENKMHKKLYEQSRVDTTTTLLNRNAYNDYLKKCDENKESLCCIYIDVNGLHEYNNKHGHQAGDEMLSSVAESMKECFLSKKQYRVGGDEFIVICENAQFKDIVTQLKQFRASMKQKKIHVATGMEWRDENMRIEDIVKAADIKMYQDKQKFYQDQENERRASYYI